MEGAATAALAGCPLAVKPSEAKIVATAMNESFLIR